MEEMIETQGAGSICGARIIGNAPALMFDVERLIISYCFSNCEGSLSNVLAKRESDRKHG